MSRVGYIRGVGLMLVCALVAAACTTETDAATTRVATTVASTTTLSTITTVVPETTTSTTTLDQRIAEVTEIVREVEFGWFDAIYRKDEAALADWVAREESVEQALGLMNDAGFFESEPTVSELVIEVLEILVDRVDCLAVVFAGDATSFRGPNATGEVKSVFWPRPSDGSWRRAYQGDEWLAACDDFSREGQLP